MSIRLQIIIFICMVIAIVYILRLISTKLMEFKIGLGWILGCVCVMILAVFPNLLVSLSNLLGIASPVNMLFLFGFLISLFMIFSMSLYIGQLTDKVKKLSQELAILRKDAYDRVNELKDSNNSTDSK